MSPIVLHNYYIMITTIFINNYKPITTWSPHYYTMITRSIHESCTMIIKRWSFQMITTYLQTTQLLKNYKHLFYNMVANLLQYYSHTHRTNLNNYDLPNDYNINTKWLPHSDLPSYYNMSETLLPTYYEINTTCLSNGYQRTTKRLPTCYNMITTISQTYYNLITNTWHFFPYQMSWVSPPRSTWV